MVDGITVGVATGGMRLRFLTVATDAVEKTDYRLMAESKGNEAIVVLADTPYYESLESAMKIRKYVKQRNVSHTGFLHRMSDIPEQKQALLYP